MPSMLNYRATKEMNMKTIDRRGFLKLGAAAAAWTPFSGMGAETPMTNKPIYIVD